MDNDFGVKSFKELVEGEVFQYRDMTYQKVSKYVAITCIIQDTGNFNILYHIIDTNVKVYTFSH